LNYKLDGKKIGLIEQDNTLFPIEIKSAASINRSWSRAFQTLDRFSSRRGHGAVICLADQRQSLDAKATAVPITEI
jgi:hypothetical protein